jgi:uncharacterized repeat protein (TIGR03803 family)
LEDFDNTNGAIPTGLVQASDGKLYGMTIWGGSSSAGVIFSFDLISSTYTKLTDFDHTNGSHPSGSLMQASDGKLYGLTSEGGNISLGVIFSFDPSSSTYTKLKDFDYANGGNPQGSLMQASDGKLYGLTSEGGNISLGVIFSFELSSFTYTKLKDFDGTNGANPRGSLMQSSDGKLYGLTYGGGSNGAGVIFSFDPSASNYSLLKDFGVNEDGSNISASLMRAKDGKLYGMTTNGGSSRVGSIFSYNPSSTTYTKLKDFDYTNGSHPYGSLLQASDGKLYGITSGGGINFNYNDNGVIFSFDPTSSSYTKLMNFDWYGSHTGAYPYGSLMQARDGKLYGMTSWGGNCYRGSGTGVIFSFDPSSSTYTRLKGFADCDNPFVIDDINGSHPYGSLMQASDGKLYGMTSVGGNSNYGVIFSFDPSSSIFTKLKDLDSTNGANPYGSLMQASDGKLYGMTYGGGSSNAGVIFSYDPTSSSYVKLKDFDYANGSHPYGSLMQASDGKLYGMTSGGGNDDYGVIFSFDPSSSTYKKLIDYNGANGANPYIGSAFIEVPKSAKALLSINDVTAYEAAGSVTLTVTLSKKTAQDVSVNYKTVDGTARSKANKPNPADYIAKSGTVTIPAGSQTATITFTIIADNLLEPSEQFYVEFGKPVNAAIGKSTGTVTILDGVSLNSTIVTTSNAHQQFVNEEQQIAPQFILNASPNPSSSQFILKIESDNTKEILKLRVVDVLGKVIEVKNNVFVGQTLQIGSNYRPGVYFAELTQGNNKKQLKLIKL